MADALNQQFQSVFVVENDSELSELPEFSDRAYIAELDECVVTKLELELLDRNKARGVDCVSPYYVLC